MQSGIKASQDLQDAFSSFTSDQSLFALPVTITSEYLQPLEAVPFGSSSDLKSALPSLGQHVQPKTPIFLLMRDAPNTSSLTAVTYIPTNAPVRSKTLFASTRATLVRELGIEKFHDTLFCTEIDEILDPKQWAGRKSDKEAQSVDSALLSTEERELQDVRRAEDEERFGTKGRDVGVGGTIGEVQAGNRLKMKIADDAKDAVASLSNSEGGDVVQLGVESEALVLRSTAKDVQPGGLGKQISDTEPTYTFYRYPGSSGVLFIYTCPSGSKIKDRMVYASSRAFVPLIAKDLGVDVVKRLEFGTPEEVTADALKEVVEPKSEESGGKTGGGFARPKRPGKR